MNITPTVEEAVERFRKARAEVVRTEQVYEKAHQASRAAHEVYHAAREEVDLAAKSLLAVAGGFSPEAITHFICSTPQSEKVPMRATQ